MLLSLSYALPWDGVHGVDMGMSTLIGTNHVLYPSVARIAGSAAIAVPSKKPPSQLKQ